MPVWRWPSPSPESTREAARRLAGAADSRGLVVALVGPLGAGKTHFTKGLAAGLGIDPDVVTSPTFVITNHYPAPAGTRKALFHVDLYRVADRDELEATGFADLFEPGALVVVEWADRLPQALPVDRLEISIERPDPSAAPSLRLLNAIASGAVSGAALARWQAAMLDLASSETSQASN